MAVIEVQSIKELVKVGKVVDLTNDYRTAITVRSSLPGSSFYAMSAGAFRQFLQQQSVDDMRTRVDGFCDSLSHALGVTGKPATPAFEYRFFGRDRQPQSCPLKLQWFAPDRYWVILLPDEEIQLMTHSPEAVGST